jgi:hypothetical protein
MRQKAKKQKDVNEPSFAKGKPKIVELVLPNGYRNNRKPCKLPVVIRSESCA